MEAGFELDNLIHQKIMGGYERLKEANDQASFERVRRELVPEYSTDISAAWEVAQKVLDLDDDHEFVIHLSQSKYNECTVEIRYWDRSTPDDPILAGPFFILGKTAPHAICLAALGVMGVGV